VNVSLLTVFPELYDVFLKTSLMGRSQEKSLVAYDVVSYFSYVKPKERIDAPTFGPGPGMLLRPDLVEKFILEKEAQHGKAFKVFFSPQGKKLDQRLLQKIAHKAQETQHLMLLPARYEGMDARVEEEYADLVVSLGDYVIMAGDLPAMILLEGVMRLLPGVVGNKESIERESFSGPFVDYPEYTAPVMWKNREVPEIIRSGDHGRIAQWRQEKAAEKTAMSHFDWLRAASTTPAQRALAQKFIPSHHCVLMHDEIVLPGDQVVGTTSVTSLDIHDIARSACTYGIKNYFIVTPLLDQKKIVERLLSFWKTGIGVDYNKHRHQAVSAVTLLDSLNDVVAALEQAEGKKPLLIATSARSQEQGAPRITYFDQERVWQEKRPVLFIFGTGHGLAPSVIERCDFLLLPVEGLSDFNHLSVRSAAAIIFDRWLGLNYKNIE
jgi:tRNA (guanine37-N1)-methyltransferase